MKLTNDHLQTIINALRIYEEKLMDIRMSGDTPATSALQRYIDGSLGDIVTTTEHNSNKPEHEIRLEMVREILKMVNEEIYGQLEIDLSLNQGKKVETII